LKENTFEWHPNRENFKKGANKDSQEKESDPHILSTADPVPCPDEKRKLARSHKTPSLHMTIQTWGGCARANDPFSRFLGLGRGLPFPALPIRYFKGLGYHHILLFERNWDRENSRE
jgi:hypothetical protein